MDLVAVSKPDIIALTSCGSESENLFKRSEAEIKQSTCSIQPTDLVNSNTADIAGTVPAARPTPIVQYAKIVNHKKLKKIESVSHMCVDNCDYL